MTSEETQISEELKGCYENLIVIDIGANLTNKKYGRDLDSVVQRAKDAGGLLKDVKKTYVWLRDKNDLVLQCRHSRLK